MGDIRKKGFIVPLGFYTMESFLRAGFRLKELIVKEQYNMKGSEKWRKRDSVNFYLLVHEHLFIFIK